MAAESAKLLKYKTQLKADNDEAKLRHIIKRLEAMPMTYKLLSTTMIGKVLNENRQLSKYPELHRRSKGLIKKWKEIASASLSSESEGEEEVAVKKPKTEPKVEPKMEPAASSSAPVLPGPRVAAFTPQSGLSFDAILTMKKPSPKKHKKSNTMKTTLNGQEFTLPKIAPTYRPSADSFWEDERGEIKTIEPSHHPTVDTTMFKSKKARTQVFAGRRAVTYTSVPTLFDACIRVVADNIDAIEDTGDIPYEILRPVLERATHAQLFYIEHRNPYLAEDSDELWERHAGREFKSQCVDKEEDETWKEFYLRQRHEREERLKAITAKVSAHSKAVAQPTRTAKTMLEAKAPRDIRRKQQKNGLYVSARERVAGVSEIVEARRRIDEAHPSDRPKEAALYRPAAPELSGGGASVRTHRKPAKAPLMAKIVRKLGKRR